MKWKEMGVSRQFLPRREWETGEFFNKIIMGNKLSSQWCSVTKDNKHQNVQDSSIGCQNHAYNILGR